MNTSTNNVVKPSGCQVKTSIRAGGVRLNHNQTTAQGLNVKSQVKAGGPRLNHNSTVALR